LPSDLARTVPRAPYRPRNAPAAVVSLPLAALGISAAVAATVVAIYISLNRLAPGDVAIERAVQSVQWGPLTSTFQILSWIGDAKGFAIEVAIFLLVLAVNRPAWLIAVGAALSGAWYEILSHLIYRARPTTADVLRVTEHPGGSSFPSGHTIFICTVMTVLVVCLCYRFLGGRGRALAWMVAAAVIVDTAIARMYSGAHWPSDVLAGILIAIAWLSLLLSWRAVSERIRTPQRREPIQQKT
jgi:membrane-associated phospholipid phosphatase